MRRQIIHIVILLFTAILQLLSAFSQSVTLNFTCRDASNQYVQLNRIVINNLTKGWEETIWWPDTTLILQNGTGIQDLNQSTGFYLTQNIPNPFDGKTEVTLFTNEGGETILSVYDLNGSLIASNSQKLEKGFHQFSIQLAATQSYLLTASSNGCRSSIKMVNSGGEVDNQINYLGVKNKSHFVKSESNKPFSFGDMMQYVGFGWINNTETESTPITQVQNSSQAITVYIPFSLPTIFTKSVSDITPSSAVCGGIVTSDGNDSVTARGVSWSTSQNPTINDNITADGSGMGSFTSSLTGLIEETTYYVRAYAINNAGISYGAQHSFTTTALIQLPTVTTNAVSNITSSSVICGGDVTSDGGATITARGVCWGTSQNPTVSGSHTTDGSGAGIFTSSITGLTAGTTYHVRAYATNSTGTAYGEQQTFTTTTPIQLPTVTTDAISDITTSSATCGGNVTSDGGANITARGVCWGTSQNPTISGSHTADGSDAGVFTSSITGLTAGTTYHVRAYATNSAGTAYGEQRTFTTTIPIQLPTVTTDPISDITNSSATCGGNVTSDGGATITARGVCWGTLQNPTISGNHTADGSGAGDFTSSITGLTTGTTYYVRAYATNSAGTAYGEQQTFTTTIPVQLPIVSTNAINNITPTSASCGGNVTSDGGADITTRGVCWSTSQNPTMSGNHTSDGSGTGNFTSSIVGLTAGTEYYVRAYATNSAGTAYGNEVSFTTSSGSPSQDGQPCPNAPTVTDFDGNTYNTVQIGNQCWMKENLRTTHYANGESILGSNSNNNLSTTTAYRYSPNNSSINVPVYGYLYNWPAVMNGSSSSNSNPSGVQGICPNGWHVPSDAEWTQLINYVGGQLQYQCNNNNNYIAKSLASNIGWDFYSSSCTVGNNPNDNNATGFFALPAGSFYHNHGVYGVDYEFGETADFWSTTNNTEYGESYAYARFVVYRYANVLRDGNYKGYGSSVRCLRDEGCSSTTQLPTVITMSVADVSSTSATCGGDVSSDGGEMVIARGVCWSTSQNPTVNGSHTTDGNGLGVFTSVLTNLTSGTTYHVRAYATNGAGTAYGNEVSFTTSSDITTQDGQPCFGTATVSDVDGNVYNTVQIGNQCWMKENLRTTKYADGTSITLVSSASVYYPGNNSSNVANYGNLYNWFAVMRNSSSSYTNPSGVQGICPEGWHVPSDVEWTQLTDYVSGQSAYLCGADSTYIAKSLAHTQGWSSSTNTCVVGNNPSLNNTTGFGALPAGCCNGVVSTFGLDAEFWSATHAYYRCLTYNNSVVRRENNSTLNIGLSVRCLRNESPTSALPSVITNTVSNITNTSANCGGNVTSDGGATVTARGVCWSTSQNPTLSDSHTTDGSGVGSFTSSITGLTSETTYYVRAYATNSAGTNYGASVAFTTAATSVVNGQPCPDAPMVTDHEGNEYNTVQIGNQCWMKENLRTTTSPSTGTYLIPATGTSYTYTGKQARWYNNDSATYAPQNYGLLYNWNAAVDTFNTEYEEMSVNSSSSNAVSASFTGYHRGICPEGWHLPSDAEWTTLTTYVSSQSEYTCEGNTISIAKALSSETGWNNCNGECYPGDQSETMNNVTGFSVAPAGYCLGSSFNSIGYSAGFWSSSQLGSDHAYHRAIGYNSASVNRNNSGKYDGKSIRCLRDDNSTTTLPSVTTNIVSNITSTSATCSGNVIADGGSTVTTRSVCWSTSQNPTVIYDAFGRLLRSMDAQGSSVQAEIDLSPFVPGVYLIKAMADGNVLAVRKVVKQ